MNLDTIRETYHAEQRMSQRGISKAFIETVLDNGTVEQEKISLNKKNAQRLLEKIRKKERVLMKIIDKGGVCMVVDHGVLITLYNMNK